MLSTINGIVRIGELFSYITSLPSCTHILSVQLVVYLMVSQSDEGKVQRELSIFAVLAVSFEISFSRVSMFSLTPVLFR